MPDPLIEYVKIGDRFTVSKTLTETDLAMFCSISGDFDPIHVDDEYAKSTIFGRRIAHGLLSIALLSTVAAKMSARAKDRGFRGSSVSMGFDKLRFVKPVFIGDTLTGVYLVDKVDTELGRSLSSVSIVNQSQETCAAGTHVMRWLQEDGAK
ncbi:MAG: MaoC family dehydratase [Silicimonas sp.]